MFLKRAQILLAETWCGELLIVRLPISSLTLCTPFSNCLNRAAFHPLPSQANTQHPIFPNGIGQLTMFADYRVPQILYTLGIIDYAPEILGKLS